MSRFEKLLLGMKQNPKNVSFEELDKVLKKCGFERRNPGSGSSHYTYAHPQLMDILTVPKSRPVKAVYVKRALQLIELLDKEGD